MTNAAKRLGTGEANAEPENGGGKPATGPSVPAGPKHANNFGFIRLLLATLVVLQHAVFLVDGNLDREPLYRFTHVLGLGSVAVVGFFVLSGFLISQSWDRTPKLRSFLANRGLRIYPGFLTAACVTVFIFGRLGANDPDYFRHLQPLQIVKCLVTLQIPGGLPAYQELPMAGVLNGAFWTIPLEFLCYLCVPVLGCLRPPLQRWVWPGLLMTLLGVPEAAITRVIQPWILPTFRDMAPNFITLLPSFVAGMCFYLYRDGLRFTRWGIGAAAGCVLLCQGSMATARIGLPLAGGYLLFALAFAHRPALRAVGQRVDLSYGIYLYHWPCQLLILSLARWMSPWVLFPVSLAGAAGLAWVSWTLVEQPALRLKSRLRGVER